MTDSPQKSVVDEAQQQTARDENHTIGDFSGQNREAPMPFPIASFEVLVNSLAVPAMMNLGITDSAPQKSQIDEAKFYIDLLSILEQKTKGNLDVAENNIMMSLLYELRMAYVKVQGNTGT